jgi:cytochrome oxidase Cu insertion factor (SCO1/SenC/PrrC family)
MKTKQLLCLSALLLTIQFVWAQNKKVEKRIIIVEGPIQTQSGLVTLNVYPFRHERFEPWIIKEIKQPVKNGYARWEIDTKVPVAFMNGLFSYNMAYLAEPGDSIHISHLDKEIAFSGKGAEKFRVSKMVEKFLDTIKGIPEKGLSDGDRQPASSLEDYLRWNDYLNRKTKEWNLLLGNSKNKISELAYLDLKDRVLRHIEKIRMHKFHSIRRSSIVGPVNQFGLTNENLCHIYDSTMDNTSSKWLRYGRDYIFPTDYPWDMLHDEDYRRHRKFFRTSESDTLILGDEADKFVSIYNMIKEKYKGIARENLLAYTFYTPSGALREGGLVPKIEAILSDYYAQPGYPEFKQRVKEYELEIRARWNLRNAPEFSLTDIEGKEFRNEQLKGKVAIIDFWFTGCTGCVQMAPAMRKVEEYFANDTNIVFLSISIDKNKDQWRKSIQQGKYTSGGGVQLYTGGEGSKHDIIKKLLVESYPTFEIIDPNGLFVKYDKKKVDPRNDNGKSMREFLQKQLSILKDGPYVFHEGDQASAYLIDAGNLSKQQFTKVATSKMCVQTDGRNRFTISLKSSLQPESSEYNKPENLFVLSDIEGNFDQFRKLLQSNKIIDENYNWIFGNGHLVFGGDMFDRGRQVTECLWLIYSLEEKAKAAGGYVHFVLGNHEIMNMQGEHSYVERKYKDNAALMGKTLIQLYNENSELGRWLRTKNIVEKVGDLLFMHGGISRKLNQLPVTVSEINQLARPNYATYKKDYGDEKTTSIMDTKTSPFWYRQYYDDKKGMLQIIDSTLQKFNVNRIITGHTIVADTISVHYGGKVINTDTKHAEGKSEALLIEGDKFYRVNAEGKRVLLFIDDKKKSIHPSNVKSE